MKINLKRSGLKAGRGRGEGKVCDGEN